jgi:Ca-activated chloride channel family protein
MRGPRLIGPLAAVAALVCSVAVAQGAGLLVPKDEGIPPLAIKYLRVDATIDNQVATTHVVQEFQNSTSRNLECTYIFPLPKGAAIREFAMYIGGKRMTGELLEKDKARQVYEEIVRRTRDPGLLEYMDGSVLRLRIFPVPANGTQKVELEYSELVPLDGGLAEYVFPLRMGEKASRTLEDFTVAVRIKSAGAIKNVYSPTHEVGVSRPSDHEAVAGMESKGSLLDRDFQLFYTLSEKDFGLTLMTYRPDPDKPGMFLVLLSPKSEINAAERAPRDVAFVVDTSGSMKGEKIEQVKKALASCLDQLDPKDRFAIVQFSTAAEGFADGWTAASDENRKKAREWVARFEASGGTNIEEALQRVFALAADEARSETILFLTDGRPTVGATDIQALLKFVKDANKRSLRIFTFGVGDDVNTHLLDRMANETGGLPEYVRPSEAIDAKVTRLFTKMSYPVLTVLAIEIPGVKVTDLYPKQPPDLFRGGQVVLLGSYEGSSDSVIRLKGRVGKKAEEFVYEGTFPKKAAERTFIGPLYAHRKVGYLLDQIRLHGEEKELRDEVVRLSLAYGIETPYTSYLVLENEQQYKQYGVSRKDVTTAPPSPAAKEGRDRTEFHREEAASRGKYQKAIDAYRNASHTAESPTPAAPAGSRPSQAKPDAATNSLSRTEVIGVGGGGNQIGGYEGVSGTEEELKKAQTGAKAVEIAQQVAKMKQAQSGAASAASRIVQKRGGREFVAYRGVWVDGKFDGTERLTKIKWGSEAFFRLVREHVDLKEAFSLGQKVVVVTAKGQAVVVDPEDGLAELSDEAAKAIFTDAAAAPAK